MAKPFISYAREDRDAALRLHADLTRLGATPWIDVRNLQPGQDWELAIKRALRDCTHVIALISGSSVTKRGFVQKELRQAIEILEEFPPETVFLIPARLDDSHPAHEKLNRLHWVDLFPDFADGVRQIAKGLGLSTVPERRTARPLARAVPSDVPPEVMQIIHSAAVRDFPEDFSTRQFQINRQVAAWRDLQIFDPENVPDDVLEVILRAATRDFPDDFSTRLFQAQRQVEAWRELQNLGQGDMPDDDFRAVVRAAQHDFPDDFSTRLFQIRRQIESWRQMYS